MSADRILQKIKDDAAREAAEIIAAAKEKAGSLLESVKTDANEKADATLKEADAAALELKRRAMLIAGLEARKNTLASKRAVIDEAFARAREELVKLDGDAFTGLVTALVIENCDSGDEKVLVPASQRDKYASAIQAANAALAAQGKKGAVEIGEKPAPFDAGFLIVGEKSDVNCSFDALLRNVRESDEREIAALLFGTEV